MRETMAGRGRGLTCTSTVSSLSASSCDPAITPRWPETPEEPPGATADTARLRLEVIAKTHSGISGSHSDTDGREKTKSLMNI